ncbi:MAG: RNA polymerase sigma factor [Cyclobacteriaceae bacterium]|nr:RNA polymerase sigma factor [Cyclobacteriaceae bacterium]
MEESELVKKCLQGDRQSLERLIQSIQVSLFNLALRFLWNRQDAEDATQEILLKIITNLSKFDGRSKFNTWAYRVAINYLISFKQTKLESIFTSFESYAEDLATYKAPIEYNQPDKALLEKEIKTGCTLAMLQCLNRQQRIAFIVGGVLKINSKIGAEITDTTPENFRKRLEQAREILSKFLQSHCGVYNLSNSCRCSKRINTALACGRVQKENLNFADKIETFNDEMEELSSLSGIYQNHGTFKSNADIIFQLQEIMATKKIIAQG